MRCCFPNHFRIGTLPLKNFADMLRARTINAETAELLSAGMQQLVGGLGSLLALDKDHGTTDVH